VIVTAFDLDDQVFVRAQFIGDRRAGERLRRTADSVVGIAKALDACRECVATIDRVAAPDRGA
jgi:hypothetical protein